MPILQTGKRVVGGSRRGAEALATVTDFVILFIDESDNAMSVADDLAQAFNNAIDDKNVRKSISAIRRMKKSRRESVEEFLGRQFRVVSVELCNIWQASGVAGGCTGDTLSAEVARRRNTSIAGAHAYMLRFVGLLGPGGNSLARELLRIEGRLACERGDLQAFDDMEEQLGRFALPSLKQPVRRARERCLRGRNS